MLRIVSGIMKPAEIPAADRVVRSAEKTSGRECVQGKGICWKKYW